MRRRLLAGAIAAALSFGWTAWTGLPAATAAPAGALPTTPIEHFVYLLQGDRSFDNYFGTYPGADGIPPGTCQKRVVTGTDSGCVKPFPLHGKTVQALGAGTVELDNQYDEGRMDGFVAAYQNQGRDGSAVMGYYDQRDLPTYWGLANRYVLFDRFFSATRSGERVNRSYWVSGSAPPTGSPAAVAADYAKHLTIFDRLQAAGVDWKFYVQGYDPRQTYRTASRTTPTTQPVRVPLLNYPRFLDDPALSSHIVDLSQYYRDLDSGQLPAVSYIASNGPSERSARSIDSGQQLVTNLVGSLMVSSSWKSSAFLLSYDGSGGWFDHVKPPQVDSQGYGMRVPALLVSPYARPGSVNSTVLDYTSALAFIEDNWKLAPLASRDAAATPITAAFDFGSAPRPADVRFTEPLVAPASSASVALVFWCYGAVLCLVAGLVGYAVVSSRRRATGWRPGPPSAPGRTVRALPVRVKP
ncbi:alkaline phosphatase family protein [Jatrophihabitans sp.]|uniref:alkaline phosphatase family protein n=1 Tax=Jatrophihabitans sp. TaxID=1932789 RepID=UPI002BFBEC56|nr:alkaline phosphatase family protein [Jatrophihabitans sp.]